MSSVQPRYRVVDFADVPSVDCPCGTSRRALADVDDYPATVHLTEISTDAQTHYHRSHAETYYILSCEADAKMQLDDEVVPVRQGLLVHIPAGVRHRAIGRMTILNIVVPKFDPADEHIDE